MHAGTTVLALAKVRQAFQRKVVLEDVSLQISSGITGVVGVNGAGKSTLLDICAGVRKPTGGSIRWASEGGARISTGYLPQTASLPNDVSVEQVVRYSLWLRGFDRAELGRRVEEVLERSGLESIRTQRIGKSSGGTMHRIAFAVATAHDPTLLVLDEPTTGLDAEQRALVRNLIAEYGETCAVLISSHIAEDIEALCDAVVGLKDGRVVFSGSPKELKSAAGVASMEEAIILTVGSKA